MGIRYWAAGLTAAGALSASGFYAGYNWPQDQSPAERPVQAVAAPAVILPQVVDLPAARPRIILPEITDLPEVEIVIAPPTALDIHPEPWTREIASGEILDSILLEAGLSAADRLEASRAINKEYDLRRLRPGHKVTVEVADDGAPLRVALAVSDGKQIDASFDGEWATQVFSVEPELSTVAREARVRGSISSTLSKAGIPTRFATDLAQALSGKVNFRREMRGGETLRLMWEEDRIETGRIGQPRIAFASLDLRGKLYEAVWSEGSKPMIFEDGEVIRVFSKPLASARLTSRFGMRTDPMDGSRRMHSGIDFGAPTGTPVYATAPGRVIHAGDRGGYGILVEISHGAGVTTRYAHLNKLADGIKKGSRVEAGQMIARVGNTGKSTGPHLHYEVRANGKATDPLADDRLAEAIRKGDMDAEARARLADARALMDERLETEVAGLSGAP